MIAAALRRVVRERAGDRCEYCRLAQADAPAVPFHIEHIIAGQHGGSDDPDNLALACHRCNLHKGPNLSGIDPVTNEVFTLFNPRRDRWDEHFELRGHRIEGRTPTGRATVAVLAFNLPIRVELRRATTGG